MIPVVVITQKRYRGRLEQFRVRWEARNLGPYEVYDALEFDDPVRGCFFSHLDVLRSHSGPLAIFEDDAIFAPNFTLDITPPRRANIIWLGGQHLQPPTPIAPGWVQPTSICRSHAYITDDTQRLARQLPVEPRRHYDMALNEVDLPKLALAKFTVGQAAGVSSISGAHHQNHRFWND